MFHNDEFIAETLRDLGLVTKAQIEAAREHLAEEGLIQTLVNDGIVTEEDIARALAAQNSMEFVDVTESHPERRVLDMLEGDDARRGPRKAPPKKKAPAARRPDAAAEATGGEASE